MLNGFFCVMIQSSDRPVPSTKLNVGERPCLDHGCVQPDIEHGGAGVERGVGKQLDRTYRRFCSSAG